MNIIISNLIRNGFRKPGAEWPTEAEKSALIDWVYRRIVCGDPVKLAKGDLVADITQNRVVIERQERAIMQGRAKPRRGGIERI